MFKYLTKRCLVRILIVYYYYLSVEHFTMGKTLRHLHTHIKHHHKKYLFGIFGGYAIVKLFLLLFGISFVQYAYHQTFAQLATGCVFTGQYYTGEYQTWGYLTWQELTWGYMTWCTTLSGYRTWGALDESGTLTWQTRVEETQTWCVLTWQELTWGYVTGWYLTWGYRTWGYITGCLQETWLIQTGTNQTWTNQTGNILLSWNSICESGDIVWHTPIPWSIARNIIPISWTYSWTDCLSWLSLQLRDHNSQRIPLATLASWATWYTFDSKSLASFQQSGFYHVIWTGTSGQYYLYTGIATGTYSRLSYSYKLRLLTPNQTAIYETQTFTINNEIPTLTWMSLLSSWSSTGYLAISGVVVLNFTASQVLTWVQVTLWSGKIPTSSSLSWLLYTYTWLVSSWYAEGPLVATITFADTFWTTGIVLYTWSLLLDTTAPVLTGFVFSGYTSWVYFNFTWSEPIRYTINYYKTGWTVLSGFNASYLTAQQFIFSGIERDQLYTFAMNVYDAAGNVRSLTGDILQTALGTLLSHAYIVPLATTIQTTALSWTLATLGVVLRAEIEKFNACKNALNYTPIDIIVRNTTFSIQMPMFKKTQMKTLVNAFTLFVLDKVKHNYSMTSGDIAEMTKKFDNFLIILKLLRDDDNVCKQNLSNYHINQFQKSLEEYNISLK